MQQIKDLINRMLWDEKERKEDYSFFYRDRITNRNVRIRGDDIRKVEGSFITVERSDDSGDSGPVDIPIHRIRRVEKRGVILLKR
ncbi:MAG: DUF504 domain-containing protein [Candidatus Woesearchaeota archaeon]